MKIYEVVYQVHDENEHESNLETYVFLNREDSVKKVLDLINEKKNEISSYLYDGLDNDEVCFEYEDDEIDSSDFDDEDEFIESILSTVTEKNPKFYCNFEFYSSIYINIIEHEVN